MIVDVEWDYDPTPVIVNSGQSCYQMKRGITDIEVSQIDLGEVDQVVETSTFCFGTTVDPPFHDLFVVESKDHYTSQSSVDLIMSYVDTLGDLGPVVDFGAGYKRPYCTKLNVIEHVEWQSGRTKCFCGCEVTPYATPFYFHKQLKTFLAINSLQNNSYSFIQRILAQIVVYELDFVIVQPMNLKADEFDCSHLICSMFAGVEVALLPGGSMTVYSYIRARVHKRIEDAKAREVETCVTMEGLPILRDEKGPKQSVLVFALTDANDLLVVEADNGGPVDFIAAGHVTYGETPMEAARREWQEEMLTPVPVLEHYGMVKPPISVAKAYVFVCNLNLAQCHPSRGKVRILRADDFCRHDFYPSIRALNRYFCFSDRFDLDAFCSKHYEWSVKRDYKELLLEKHRSDPQFIKFSSGHNDRRYWAEIYKKYAKQFNQHCRVKEQDLKNKFRLDMRSTNQAARIFSPIVPGNLVVLNADNLTPCPIVTLEYNGRQVGYCTYIKCVRDQRLYRVVECNAKFEESDRTIVNYTFKRRFDTEITDTSCGANLLAEWKNCSYDEAVSLIRSGMQYTKIWAE